MSSVVETRRKVTLFRGVYPVKFKGARDPEKALTMAEDELLKRGAVTNGDYMGLTIGEPSASRRHQHAQDRQVGEHADPEDH